MRELLFILLFLFNVGCHAASPCHPSKILGEVKGLDFVGKKPVPITEWTELPSELSLHDGEYGRLKFKDGDKMKFTYNGTDLEGKSFKKVLESPIGKEKIANVNLIKWFMDAYTFNGGKIEMILYKKNKKICTHNMDIPRGH